jgi:hypothetical protein
VIGVVLIAGDEGPAGVSRRKPKRNVAREPILREGDKVGR